MLAFISLNHYKNSSLQETCILVLAPGIVSNSTLSMHNKVANFSNYLLRSYYVSYIVLGNEDKAINKLDKST